MDWRQKYRPYIVAMCLAFVFTMLCAPEVVEGDLMSPTLKDGQATFIVKKGYSAKQESPDRDTIVVLEKIYSRATSEDNIIARVVALPGDTIEVKEGKIYRDGKEIADAGMAPEGKFTLEGNEVYVLSDNSESTIDSRNPKLGLVDMREIKGDMKIIVWPLSDFGMVK